MMYVLAHSGESDVKGRGGWVSKFLSLVCRALGVQARLAGSFAAPRLRVSGPVPAGTGPMHAMPLPAGAGPCHAQTGILC